MNLLCKLWGHRYHPEGMEFYCIYDCMRCGHHDYQAGPREWIWGKVWRLQQWGKRNRWGFWWCYKCTDCGLRFGRHDDSFDHIPF